MFTVLLISFLFPSINVFLALGGSVLGTIITIIMPVAFYNRAYSSDPKHLEKDKGASSRRGLSKRSDEHKKNDGDEDPLLE